MQVRPKPRPTLHIALGTTVANANVCILTSLQPVSTKLENCFAFLFCPRKGGPDSDNL